jgi:hypothetical protein
VADNPAPAFFRCSLPTDPASDSVIQHLREQGLLCADHRLRRDDRELVVLTQSELTLLEDAGVVVENLGQLVPHAHPPGSGDSADSINTGFVSGYLDAVGIAAAYADLHALFPTLTTLTDLPETPFATLAATSTLCTRSSPATRVPQSRSARPRRRASKAHTTCGSWCRAGLVPAVPSRDTASAAFVSARRSERLHALSFHFAVTNSTAGFVRAPAVGL